MRAVSSVSRSLGFMLISSSYRFRTYVSIVGIFSQSFLFLCDSLVHWSEYLPLVRREWRNGVQL